MPDWFYPYVCGAGRGARNKYGAASKRWRRRVFRAPHLVSAVLAVVIIVLAVAGRAEEWLVLAAAAVGAVLGAYLAILESPPSYIDNWRIGAEGERRTARALAPLRRSGYKLLHDLPDRRSRASSSNGNLDHVVVSSAGVFLLDSKLLGGSSSIHGESVRVQRTDDDESYDMWWLAKSVRACARRLLEDIGAATGIASVPAIVVFWNEFPAGVVELDGLVFVHGERLVAWLQAREQVLDTGRVAVVAERIAEIRRPEKRRVWGLRRAH